jgi:UDP-galactopyranose mutase
MSTPPALIVLSHLRWDFVFQRPQQLMSRLARHYRVFFVEEPVHADGPARLVSRRVADGLTVVQPQTSVAQVGFHDDQLPVLERLLETLQREEGIDAPLVWLYTPMALPLARKLGGSVLVYDCMDELSAFLNAPRQLIQRENALLRAADLVFTGGPSLYQAKQHRHPSVHCFPSSVDAAHFAAARAPELGHEAQENIPAPRLGFYGVIDERFDLALLDAVAAARPDWQLVMVGPVVKIDPAALPRRANIHYLGQRSYDELPRFLAGWDVCLLPFALNDATRYISPTKTLEYMAAGRPVVSTPITDVAVPYGNLVEIADDAKAFIDACERQLALRDDERATLVARMTDAVRRTSWEETAAQMRALVDGVAARGPVVRDARSGVVATDGDDVTDDDTLSLESGYAEHHRTVIIGAGPTGLSAAYHLGEESLLIEQNDRVGGWCRSIEDNGFTFDFAGHIMFSNDPYVHEMYAMLLGTTSTGRIERRGSTARACTRATRSRGRSTACRPTC